MIGVSSWYRIETEQTTDRYIQDLTNSLMAVHRLLKHGVALPTPLVEDLRENNQEVKVEGRNLLGNGNMENDQINLNIKALQGVGECIVSVSIVPEYIHRNPDLLFQISPAATISILKSAIEEKLNISPNQQKLVLLGKTLADENTVASYQNIKEGTKIMLVVKKPENLKEAIHRHFRKYFSETQSEHLTKEFIKNLETNIQGLSLDDLERLAGDMLKSEKA